MTGLHELGWDAFFDGQLTDEERSALLPARVSAEHRNGYEILTQAGERFAEVPGRMRFLVQGGEDLPAVGDWVLVEGQSNQERTTLRRMLARKSAISRKAAGGTSRAQVLAANMDVVFLVLALTEDFNLRRLERYVTLAWESGAEPLVLLTKADLCADSGAKAVEARGVARGVEVLVLSALRGDGMSALQPYLAPGRTAVLLGSSGAGKSTLVNALAQGEVLATQATGDDGTGRHTTTHRQLVPLPSGGMLIDTPGMRELGLPGSGEGAGYGVAFQDLAQLALQCRFRDCQHETEPGCAVLAALDNGTLDLARFESWRKLGRELAYEHRRTNLSARRAQQQKWKEIHRALKHHPKYKR